MGHGVVFHIHVVLGNNYVDLEHDVEHDQELMYYEARQHSHHIHHNGNHHSHNHKQNPELLVLLEELELQALDFSVFSSLFSGQPLVLKQLVVVIEL